MRGSSLRSSDTCPLAVLDLNLKNLELADSDFDRYNPVDLLLGADVFSQVMDGKRVIIRDSLPVAFGSVFGWVVIDPNASEPYQSNFLFLAVSSEDIVHRF